MYMHDKTIAGLLSWVVGGGLIFKSEGGFSAYPEWVQMYIHK